MQVRPASKPLQTSPHAMHALRTRVDDDPVLGQLLLDEDDLLGALDHKVAARVQGALPHTRQLLLALPCQHAPVAGGSVEHAAVAVSSQKASAKWWSGHKWSAGRSTTRSSPA